MGDAIARLDVHSLEFLTESNAIEGIHEVDYRRPENTLPGRGHFGALIEAQTKALAGRRVGVENLCSWQGLLTEEQLRFGHDIPRAATGFLRSPDKPIDVQVGSHVAPTYKRVPELLGTLVSELWAVTIAGLCAHSPPFITTCAAGGKSSRARPGPGMLNRST